MFESNVIFEGGKVLQADKGNEIIEEIIAILSKEGISIPIAREVLLRVEKEILNRARF